MKITVESLLGHKSKRVRNVMEVNNIADIDKLVKCCITDREATITREDGKETTIIYNGMVRDEIYNQKALLLEWCNLRTDEFPQGGEYRKGSI